MERFKAPFIPRSFYFSFFFLAPRGITPGSNETASYSADFISLIKNEFFLLFFPFSFFPRNYETTWENKKKKRRKKRADEERFSRSLSLCCCFKSFTVVPAEWGSISSLFLLPIGFLGYHFFLSLVLAYKPGFLSALSRSFTKYK